MKSMKILTLAMIAAFGFSAFGSPSIINQLPGALYVPGGFDDNDNTQVVFEGMFRNSCYRAGVTPHHINVEDKSITLENKVQFYPGQICMMVVLPYVKEVNLGVLPKGDYRIWFKKQNGDLVELGNLPVAESVSASADDFVYAPVSRVDFDPVTKELIVSGHFSNSCLRFREIRADYARRGTRNVIEVLPIVNEPAPSAECDVKAESYPFEERVSLEGMNEGRWLVHVRSLNGQALNTIVNL